MTGAEVPGVRDGRANAGGVGLTCSPSGKRWIRLQADELLTQCAKGQGLYETLFRSQVADERRRAETSVKTGAKLITVFKAGTRPHDEKWYIEQVCESIGLSLGSLAGTRIDIPICGRFRT